MFRILFLASLAICANAESLGQASTAKPSLLSPERIQQHLLMGWALPEPGVGERITRQTQETPQPELTTLPPHGLSQTLVQQHLLMGWSLPEAGPGPRPVRAAPRAPPAHRAHGPRAPLVYTQQGHRLPRH